MRSLWVLALCAPPALACAQHAECPLILPEGAIEIKQAPAGWLASSPSLTRLTGGGMLSGPPKEMAYLVPAASKAIKGRSKEVWHFDAGEQKWLYCSYGTAALQLSKRMDDAATECTITTREERKGVIVSLAADCN